MESRFCVGDVVLQTNWRAYYLVVSSAAPCQYDGKKINYQFQLLALDDKNVAPPELTLTRARAYIDREGQTNWQKVG